MVTALIAAVFFVLLVWVRRSDRRAAQTARRLQTDLADSQQQLEKSQQRVHQIISLLTELHEHKVSPAGAVSWTQAAEFTVQAASHLTGMETTVLMTWDPTASEFRPLAARGLSPKQLAELRVRLGEGILGKASQTGQTLVENETSGAASVTGAAPGERFLTAPYLVLPLWRQSQMHGFMVYCRPHEGPIGPETMRLATLMAKHVELVLENLDLYDTRQRVYNEMVHALAHAVNIKGVSAPQHGERVRNLVQSMARAMHLPAMLAEQIEYGALLHDVGKLGIDETLLLKEGQFTDAEYAIVKQHPQIGYDLLRHIGFFNGIAPIVLYHHEWVNGQGYPEGLAGEEIPLGARMVAVADAWDRMVMDQPFRKAISKNNAIAELRQQAGTQFDPQLVDVFLHVIDQQERVNNSLVSSPTGTLYIVPTPLGNLADITLRAIDILKQADLVACEDTRRTLGLLNHLGIAKTLWSYHAHSPRHRPRQLLDALEGGKTVALVCDAGTPGVSDPGTYLVQAALEARIPVVSLPGPCAAIAALVASGLPTDRFFFIGFLPRRTARARRALVQAADAGGTVVIYESPFRTLDTLKLITEAVGPQISVVVARELTKIHEEIIRGTASDVLAQLQDRTIKGEVVILFYKAEEEEKEDS